MFRNTNRRRMKETDDNRPKHNPRSQTFAQKGIGHMPRGIHIVSHTATLHGKVPFAESRNPTPLHLPAEDDAVSI